MSKQIVLASASPSRKKILETIGINPIIKVSGVDEETPELLALSPADLVIALAILKAHTVHENFPELTNSLIIGCDSTFEFEGESLGKPGSAEAAIERCRLLSGKTGYLHTGHCVIDTDQGIEVSDISTSKVTFAKMTENEIINYVNTGEPIQVAGGFTPELTAMQRRPPTKRENSSSKAFTSGPCAIIPLRSTRSTAARSSSPMIGRAAGIN